jgi:hypothetical protein
MWYSSDVHVFYSRNNKQEKRIIFDLLPCLLSDIFFATRKTLTLGFHGELLILGQQLTFGDPSEEKKPQLLTASLKSKKPCGNSDHVGAFMDVTWVI